MGINVSCGACGKGFRVKEAMAGQTGKCPFCGGAIKVPPLTNAAISVGQGDASVRKNIPGSKAAAVASWHGKGPTEVHFKRPTGLTALAVLNLGLALAVILLIVLGKKSQDAPQPSAGALVVQIICACLLALSAVGYFVQNKLLGWAMGSLFGVASLLVPVVELLVYGGRANFSNIALPVFGVLTLILLNSRFRRAFRGG